MRGKNPEPQPGAPSPMTGRGWTSCPMPIAQGTDSSTGTRSAIKKLYAAFHRLVLQTSTFTREIFFNDSKNNFTFKPILQRAAVL